MGSMLRHNVASSPLFFRRLQNMARNMHLFLFLQCEEGGDHGDQHVVFMTAVEDTHLKRAVFMRLGECQTHEGFC
jgi:hypothetical protein